MHYVVPLFELQYGAEEEAAVLAAIRSKWISAGPNIDALEHEFAELLGVQHAVALTNCTAALHLAMVALGIGPGDEVIVPSLTFVATVNAVRYVGATPVFADIIGCDDLRIDPADVCRKITLQTKAIIPMHYGGYGCDMSTFTAIAREHQLRIIEDVAHAPVVRHAGRMLGAWGDSGCFSFFANKNITCGEGGMLITNDDTVAAAVRLLRSHGMTTRSYDRARGHATRYDVIGLGYNYRMDDLRAALLRAQLHRLEMDRTMRAACRASYLVALRDVPGITIPFSERVEVSSNYIFPIVLQDGGAERRDAVRAALRVQGVETSVHYPAVHRFSAYTPYAAALPHTEHVADHLITLPMFSVLTDAQIAHVATSLRAALTSYVVTDTAAHHVPR